MLNKKAKAHFTSIGKVLDKYQIETGRRYVSVEFQDYGYRLAVELDDEKRISLYIKLAKEYDRSLIETARNFIKDAQGVKNKARLFMWKLTQLKAAKIAKTP